MAVIKNQLKIQKDLDKIRKFSALVEEKLSHFNQKNSKTIENLTYDELQDLNKILQLADFVLCKHEDKKEFHSILKEFVSMINNSSSSIESLNDEIDELLISADSAISRIKELKATVVAKFSLSFKKSQADKNEAVGAQTGGNNLTNSSTPVYT